MNIPGFDSAEISEGTQLLDRYTIIDRIAGGGMATIYRATDERFDRVVCVKLLRLVVEDSGSTGGGAVYQATYSHFLKEALALSKLAHPNTLRIYDFGYLDSGDTAPLTSHAGVLQAEAGRPFQISEFLDGGNLEQFVRARGALLIDEALAIVERMAGAVAEAHQHQIIHRDIKPSNILFSRIGGVLMPKLADFGIARCDLRKRPKAGEADDTAAEVVSTVPLFSPRWAAPEQLAATEEGPSTDVYALALVAVFMLSGKPIFDADDVRSTFSERVLGDDLVTRRLTELGFANEVHQVLLRALRASPRDRLESPLAFYEELNHALGGARTSLLPPNMPPNKAPSPPARAHLESITVEAIIESRDRRRSFAPPEQWIDAGGRRVRIVEIHEKLDLGVPQGALDVRFRVAILPARGTGFRLHLKGLNCFVAKPEGAPTPAIVSDDDGSAALVAMTRERILDIKWSFGRDGPAGRIFTIGSADVSVPGARHALALEVGEGREVIVICRRA